MTKQIEINVSQVDIDKALAKDSSRCVVATAIYRSVPGAQRISVDVQSIRFSLGGERLVFLTPYAVAGYVVAFDAGDTIHPFRFRLRHDQKMKVRKRTSTEAGKAKMRARTNHKNAQQRLEVLADKAASILDPEPSLPPPSPDEVKAVKAELRAAKEQVRTLAEEREAVMAAYEGQPTRDPGDSDLPRAMPKVFKRGERAYGMRQLRINQHA